MIATRLGTVLVVLAVVAAACTSSATPSATTTTATSGDITAVSPPQRTEAEQVYELVAPSIVAITTDIAGGSGILISGFL